MKKAIFITQSRAPKPYTTIIEYSENELKTFCSCPAGQNGTMCKHLWNPL